MCLSRFYSLYWLCSFWIALLSTCCLKAPWVEKPNNETSLEKLRRIHAKCRKSGKQVKRNKFSFKEVSKHTRQIAGTKPPLIPITMIGIERNKKINEKKWFLYTKFLSAIYFDVILELNILLFCFGTTQGLVSIPISIWDGNWEQSSSNAHLKLGFLILTLFILNCLAEQLLSKNTLSRIREE